jgi:hypothetical protein
MKLTIKVFFTSLHFKRNAPESLIFSLKWANFRWLRESILCRDIGINADTIAAIGDLKNAKDCKK